MSFTNKGFDASGEGNLSLSIDKFRPVKPSQISIAWRNLRYQIAGTGCCGFGTRPKLILNRLNGFFEYHTLNGFMGPSGAGKTTLLNCLRGNQKASLSPESEIFLNSSESSEVTSYFIEQHVQQTIIGQLSVRQIFRYAFLFKNPAKFHDEHLIEQHISQAVHELLLPGDILNRYFEKCSGGEQKRIAIGQELMSLTKPQFLFLDEPTTGLDSSSALEVMRCLKQLTGKYRMTLIASIHVPNSETLSLFDKLYVLARGGVCIYSGAPDGIQRTLQRELRLTIGANQPPVEALIKIACYDIHDGRVGQLAQHFLHQEYSTITAHQSQLRQTTPTGLPNNRKCFSITDFYRQIRRQFRITFISHHRIFFGQVLFYIVNCVILSTIFSRDMVKPTGCASLDISGTNSTCRGEFHQNSLIYENINYLCVSVAIVGFAMISTGTVLFAPLVKVFRNEHRNQWYSLGVFYWSINVSSIVEMTIFAFSIALPSYFLTTQHAADDYQINWIRIGHYCFCIWLKSLYSQSLGQLVGVLFMNSSTVGIIVANLVYSVMDTFNDFFIKADELDNWVLRAFSDVIGLKYINRYMFYTFYGIDRCDPETEYSLVLLTNLVEPDQIGFYMYRIILNSLIVRLFTLIFMYYKFNSFTDTKLIQWLSGRNVSSSSDQMKSLDCSTQNVKTLDLNNNHLEIKSLKPISSAQFIEFSHNRIILGFRNLSLLKGNSIYEIQSSSELILRNLNGQFRFGTLNALMGMSGAGKTSLLKVLNGQSRTRLSHQTQFYLSKYTKLQTCFIAQDVSSHLMRGLTALQSLIYASRFKNSSQWDDMELDHEKIALSILDELCLADIAHTNVQRCSGGERKRLALALELTALEMPNLICIDEPTSGLDSNSSEMVIGCLQKLAHNHNLTIIASIHQPNSEILAEFEQIYVLARGGVCVYSGPPEKLHSHLASISDIPTESTGFPIEQLIKYSCAGAEHPLVRRLSERNTEKILNTNQELRADTQLVVDGIQPNRTRFSIQSVWILLLRYIAYFRGHLWKEWLAFTVILIYYANNLLVFWSPSIAIPSGCLTLGDDLNGTCSSQSEESLMTEKAVYNNLKFNVFANILFLLFIVLQASLTLFRELEYFYNEHRNGWYSSGSFYAMKVIFDFLPLLPVLALYVYICDIYEPVRPGIYWPLLLLTILSVQAAQSVAHVFILLSHQSYKIFTIILIFTFEVYLLLSNFYVSYERLHYIYQWASNLNMARFAFEAAVLLQYGFGRCGRDELQPILYGMGLVDDDYYRSLWALVIQAIVYRFVALWLLVGKVHSKSGNRRKRIERIRDFSRLLRPSRAIIAGLSETGQQTRIRQLQV